MSSTDQLGFSFKPPDRRVWTVRDLVGVVRTHVEREYGDIWVEGEISNFRAQDSGILYFTLKDQNSADPGGHVSFQSKFCCAFVRKMACKSSCVVASRFMNSAANSRFLAEYLEPKGAGALQVAFEQLKAKLETEGLFDAGHKRPIPTLPRRIGIVTSPQAAALRDI